MYAVLGTLLIIILFSITAWGVLSYVGFRYTIMAERSGMRGTLMTIFAYLAIMLCGHRHAINTNWGLRLITTEHVYMYIYALHLKGP